VFYSSSDTYGGLYENWSLTSHLLHDGHNVDRNAGINAAPGSQHADQHSGPTDPSTGKQQHNKFKLIHSSFPALTTITMF